MSVRTAMKSLQAAVTVFLLSTVCASAHTQRVHQFIVKEAYELLLTELGDSIPQMNAHIGGLEPFYQGDHAWQRAFITTGAWREDEEDVVFGYRLHNLLNNYSLVSISHFWDADQGDLNQNYFRVSPLPPIAFNIGPYENAYDKLIRYANGGWKLWYPDTTIVRRESDGHYLILIPYFVPPPAPTGAPLQYSSITAFHQTRVITLRSDVLGAYVIFDLNDQTIIPLGTPPFEIRVDTDVRDRISWEVLGRMCHLLCDMSVPAHSRRDEHGLDPDTYEDWVGAEGGPYLSLSHDSVDHRINPYNADNDPLHYLMYTMQEQANHFGSVGPYEGIGNDVIGGAPRALENVFLSNLNLPLLGAPIGNGPWTETNLRNIMNRTLPYAIQSTAGLLYWFARETNLISPAAIQPGDKPAPAAFALEQNYPNPFNPTTTIKYRLSKRGLVSLKIYDMVGREIATLVATDEGPGDKSVIWNASGAASGTYLCRLAGPDFVATRKMVLVK